MDENTNIGIGRPEDWRAYKDIWLEALEKNPEAFRSTLAKYKKRTDLQWQQELSERIFVFAKANDSVTGIIALICATDQKYGIWQISRVYTRPDFRGLGLAQQLMKKILQEVRARGGVKARLTVNTGPKQEAARKIYLEKFKFHEAIPWEERENRLFLEKDLTHAR